MKLATNNINDRLKALEKENADLKHKIGWLSLKVEDLESTVRHLNNLFSIYILKYND